MIGEYFDGERNIMYNEVYRWTPDLTEKTENSAVKLKSFDQDVLTQVDAIVSDPQRLARKAHPLKEGVDEHSLDDTVYDDFEFYDQLLKEFIASGKGNGSLQLKRKRKTKKVDRRASKGRKLKFEVHPKLENFMYPVQESQSHVDTDKLFQSLFK